MPADEVPAFGRRRHRPPEGRRTAETQAHAREQLLAEAREITAEHVFALERGVFVLQRNLASRQLGDQLQDLHVLVERIRTWAEAAQETVTPETR
jgi:hypothetical protein